MVLTLVVGSTGQLGAAVVRKLVERGAPVRALARTTSSYRHLEREGIDEVSNVLRYTACRRRIPFLARTLQVLSHSHPVSTG